MWKVEREKDEFAHFSVGSKRPNNDERRRGTWRIQKKYRGEQFCLRETFLRRDSLSPNAVKYSSAQPITAMIVPDDDRVVIMVRDEGVGIPESDLPYVFTRFHGAGHDRYGPELVGRTRHRAGPRRRHHHREHPRPGRHGHHYLAAPGFLEPCAVVARQTPARDRLLYCGHIPGGARGAFFAHPTRRPRR